MPLENRELELHCAGCGWAELCDLTAMRERLQTLGMLRRATDPEPEFVAELFRTSAARMSCPRCQAALASRPAHDAWPAARTCEGCGQPIAAARLEAIPTATYCAACQGKIDAGQAVGEAEYCPRCGAIMVLRQAASGRTRYVLRCPDCRR